MGGCSSKPKTAEFEGALEVQEDKPLSEAPRKSLEAENVGLKAISREQEPSAPSIRTLLTEREQDDVRDMFIETHNKPMIAGSSPDGNFQEERQVLEDDSQHVKQMLAETIDNSRAEKGPTLEEEILKLQVNPEVVVSELHEDPVFNMEVTKTIREEPLCSAIEAETAGAQQGPLDLPKEVLEDNEKYVFSESESPSLKDICISSVEDSSKLQVKTMGLHNGLLEVSENLSAGGKEILELQKEPSFRVAVGLQDDASTEASSKGRGNGMVESECYEAASKNEEQRLDGSVSHKEQDNQFGEGSKESGELCKETEVCAREVVNAASSAVLAQENGEEVSKDSSKPRWEDGIKGLEDGIKGLEDGIKGLASDEAPEKVITGTCINKNGPFSDASDQEPSRVNDSTAEGHPSITPDVGANSLQHVGDEDDLVQGEQEVNGHAKLKVAMKDVKLQAEDNPMNGFIGKESNAETLDTTHGDGEPTSPKSTMNDKHSLPLSVQLSLENSLGDVQGETPYAAEGQPKADALCAPNELTAIQVITTTKKPEVQSVQVMDSAELALTSAQDTPAPDIDDVLEKLASEFERQESLARATS